MHDAVFAEFARLTATLPPPRRVLEVGIARDAKPLLDLPALQGAECLGLGLDPPSSHPRARLVTCNAHDLGAWQDESFDLVLCNSMLEHDPEFWRSLSEMRRLVRPGGHIALGVPGFGAMGIRRGGWRRRLAALALGVPVAALRASSLTLGLHGYPDDHYRFSTSAMTQVLLAGFEPVSLRQILSPPRLIGLGRKPEGPAA